MAYSACTSTTQGNASGCALTVNKPAGTVDGDLLVVTAYLETGSNSWSGVGAGFNNAGSSICVASNKEFMVQTWTKIAAGEPASWSWTPASTVNWRVVDVMRYSGATGTGNEVIDVTSGCALLAAGDAAQTAPSVTTTSASDLLLLAYGNFSNVDTTTACGAALNRRVTMGGLAIHDTLSVATGATGSSAAEGAGTEDYAAMHVTVNLARAGAGTAAAPYGYLTANSGIYS